MKTIVVAMLFLSLNSHAFELLVIGLRNNEGQVRCSVFKSEVGFPSDPEKAFLKISVKPQNNQALFDFKDLAEGEYAMALLHDEDENGEMRTNLIGLPREGWAVSNNAPARMFGAPSFESALRSWKSSDRELINIRY